MTSLQGHKVVLNEEMSRIEKLSDSQESVFMTNAGAAVASVVETFTTSLFLERTVTLLVGKGNNGGDAYTAGITLLKKGFSVTAFHFFSLDTCSELCALQHKKFIKAGGKVHFYFTAAEIPSIKQSVIVDGLVGTGFQGKAEGILASAIDAANCSTLPIISIDIPSGVNGSSGAVESVAVYATQTVYLGLPKLGLFLGEGWNHVGEPIFADFGLTPSSISAAKPEAYLINEEAVACYLPALKRNQQKYEKGYVVAFAGSATMTGAAVLSAFAALRAGAGIVRLFHLDELSLGNTPPEIIHEKVNLSEMKKITEELRRAKAVLLGPGLGRTKEAEKLVQFVLETSTLPCVIDADALYFLAENPALKIPEGAVLTPHRKELERLLGKSFKDPTQLLHAAQEYVDKKRVTLVFKGAPTFILHPNNPPLIVPRGDPGMATAGSGDVLTGVIAAFLAHNLAPFIAASLGVYMHAVAGEIAAADKTSYCMVASDILESLPFSFSRLLE